LEERGRVKGVEELPDGLGKGDEGEGIVIFHIVNKCISIIFIKCN
jgi:hypothetical protein